MKKNSIEKEAIVDLFLHFVGELESKKYNAKFWQRKVGKLTYAKALEIIHKLESTPQKNKSLAIIKQLT